MKVTVRKATTQDYEPLLELFDLVDTLHRHNLPNIFQKSPGPARDQDYFKSLLVDPDTVLYLAEIENDIAGFILAIIRETPPIPVFIPARLALVTDISVKKEFRLRGIGQQLVNKVHSWAEIRGASAVELNVYAFNQESLEFYKTIGYETISLRMRFPLNQG